MRLIPAWLAPPWLACVSAGERCFSWRRLQHIHRRVSVIGKIWVDENIPPTLMF
ncbi:MAG: hypothetical protein K8R90_03920 [Candidatus Cloacimonetes bacterium]|nr:hypothetical protein [Candidatus Cloacimonadota bacterium]